MVKWRVLIVSLLVSLGVGNLAGILTRNSGEIYNNLYKPPLAPIGSVFPIVWTILFILMGIASSYVYVAETGEREQALQLYGIQLVVNFFWSIIFFELEAYWLSFVWLILLWILVCLTIKSFYRIDRKAGLLLIPYLLWLTFAGYLNFAIAWFYYR